MVRTCQGIYTLYKARQIPYKTLYKGLKIQSSIPVQYSISVVNSTVCTLPTWPHTTNPCPAQGQVCMPQMWKTKPLCQSEPYKTYHEATTNYKPQQKERVLIV